MKALFRHFFIYMPRFASVLKLRVSTYEAKLWLKNKLRNQQIKNLEKQAREKADWNCKKSGKFKNFITNGNVFSILCCISTFCQIKRAWISKNIFLSFSTLKKPKKEKSSVRADNRYVLVSADNRFCRYGKSLSVSVIGISQYKCPYR